jgi:GNAT acetyltransferase-like protein
MRIPGMAADDLAISVKGKWVRVPALEIDGRHLVATGRWIKTASVHDEGWLEHPIEDPQPYVDALQRASRHLHADILTFTQRLPDLTPRHSFPMEWDNVAAIRLENPDEWWQGLPQVARKNVRRAEKRGVTTAMTTLNDDLIRGIVAINDESPMRQGKPFYHYGKDFDSVKRDYSSFAERTEFVCAYCDGELIGFIQLVYMGRIAAVLEILMKTAHYDKRPANALIEKAVRHCSAKGMSHLTYGKYSYGNKGADNPLTEFKARNGFEAFRVPQYYVPLTVAGRICIALRLHRGLLEILPESVISPLLALRRMWYRAQAIRRPV